MSRIGWLDMLRGYALVCIMLDHMPISVLRNLTLTNFVVFDAAELFVLLSGFLVGLVWVKVAVSQGVSVAQKRFWRRAFQVWRALIIGAIALALLSALLFWFDLKHTAVWFQYSIWIIENPLGYIATVALMWMQPNLMDVLALYVLLIATVPVAVPLLQRWPWLFMAGSVAIWLAALPLNEMIPNQRPGPGLLFNPFGWQLLFFIGVALGMYREKVIGVLRPWSLWITIAASLIVLFGFTIVTAARIGEPVQALRDLMFMLHGKIDKWSLDFMRLLAVMAASWLVAVPLSGLFTRIAATRGGIALAEIGRGGLWAFVACVLLSIFGDAMEMMAPKSAFGWVLRVMIDIWVVVALWAMSAAWLRRDEFIGQYRAGRASRAG